MAHPLRRELRRSLAGPGHHAADVHTVFAEEHVRKSRRAGVLDVPPDDVLVELNSIVHIVGDELVPDKSVCHAVPSFRDVYLNVNAVHNTLIPNVDAVHKKAVPAYTRV